MTVTTTYEPATYTGDGSTTQFSLNHLVYESSHLSVKLDGVSTAAWSATGYGDAGGVTITMDSAPASGVTVLIERIVPYTQNTDLENFDGNPADVTEQQFDLLAMADQQIAEAQDRAVLAPIGTSLTTNTIIGTIDSTAKVLTITTDGPAASDLVSISTSIDAVITSAASGDILEYDGTNWINVSTLSGDLTFSGAITFDSTVLFNDVIDVTNINAETSAGINLRTNGGTNCLSLGGGGSANLTLGGNMSGASTHKLVNMADPTAAQDYATKNYVDNQVSSIGWTYGSEVDLTASSGSSPKELLSSIPSGVEEIDLLIDDMSPSGTDSFIIQLSASSTYVTSGYAGSAGYGVNGGNDVVSNFTNGFGIVSAAAGTSLHGIVSLKKGDGNNWYYTHVLGRSDAQLLHSGGGAVTLAAAIDAIRIGTTGSDTFDAGTITARYK